MKTRWKILIIIGTFCLLAGLNAWYLSNAKPGGELAAYIQKLREAGEKLELSEVIPSPTSPEQNCASAVRSAFPWFTKAVDNIPRLMYGVAPGRAMIAAQQPAVYLPGYSYLTNDIISWEEFAARIEPQTPGLSPLRDVFIHPTLDFSLNYSRGPDLLLPHLADFKKSSQAIAEAVLWNLHANDPGEATTNICTLLAVIRANQDERILITHLVHFAMTTIAIAPTWEILQATNVTETQLARLQNAWEQPDFTHPTESALLMERVSSMQTFERARQDGVYYDKLMALWTSWGASHGHSSPLQTSVGKALWRTSWSYAEELSTLQSKQFNLAAIRCLETNPPNWKAINDILETNLTTITTKIPGKYLFTRLGIPDIFEDIFSLKAFGPILPRVIKLEAQRRLTVTGIALKRYQLKYNHWPETLAQLSPEFLVAPPMDPYDGHPLRYHPNPDGTYLLYSVGEDGIDQGGDASPAKVTSTPSFDWTRGKDLVWPQPATPAEVQSYLESLPK